MVNNISHQFSPCYIHQGKAKSSDLSSGYLPKKEVKYIYKILLPEYGYFGKVSHPWPNNNQSFFGTNNLELELVSQVVWPSLFPLLFSLFSILNIFKLSDFCCCISLASYKCKLCSHYLLLLYCSWFPPLQTKRLLSTSFYQIQIINWRRPTRHFHQLLQFSAHPNSL